MVDSDAAERIILAAERLIAERGATVPLRDVAVFAGQRNNSAVHYYFGSRDGLIRAVIERRMIAMESQWTTLLAERESDGAGDDVRSLLEVLLRPMVESPYADGSTHYARFLEQVRTHSALASPVLSAEHWPAMRMIMTRLSRALADLAAETRRRRLSSMATVLFALLADHERALGSTGQQVPDDDAIGNIVSMLAGLLTAEPLPSRTPRRATRQAAASTARQHRQHRHTTTRGGSS